MMASEVDPLLEDERDARSAWDSSRDCGLLKGCRSAQILVWRMFRMSIQTSTSRDDFLVSSMYLLLDLLLLCFRGRNFALLYTFLSFMIM